MDETLESERPRFEPSTVLLEEPPPLGRVVRPLVRADRLERHLELAQVDDRPRPLELVAVVRAIARVGVHPGGPQQVQLVVMPQRPDRQAGKTREAADDEQVRVHASIVDPRATRESSLGWWRA